MVIMPLSLLNALIDINSHTVSIRPTIIRVTIPQSIVSIGITDIRVDGVFLIIVYIKLIFVLMNICLSPYLTWGLKPLRNRSIAKSHTDSTRPTISRATIPQSIDSIGITDTRADGVIAIGIPIPIEVVTAIATFSC